jgi:ubiquinone/menaquinone biosynthesis C-methylase UbiE
MKLKWLRVPNSVSRYHTRALQDHLRPLLENSEPLKVLDVGCGDGYITRALQRDLPQHRFEGAEIKVRTTAVIPMTEFDGKTLPFADKSFDVVMLVDVLHHADNPLEVLAEAARVAKRYVVLKDHRANSFFDWARLAFLDWFGNRPFGIRMTYRFFSDKEWKAAFEKTGLTTDVEMRRVQVCPPPLYYPFDYDLHIIAKLRVAA